LFSREAEKLRQKGQKVFISQRNVGCKLDLWENFECIAIPAKGIRYVEKEKIQNAYHKTFTSDKEIKVGRLEFLTYFLWSELSQQETVQ